MSSGLLFHLNRAIRGFSFAAGSLFTHQPSLRVMFDQTQLQSAYRRWLASGLEVRTVYDVGSHRGGWSETFMRLCPVAQFHCFDPLPYTEDFALQHANVHAHKILLGDRNAEVPFYSTGSTGDSIYRESTAWYRDEQPRICPMQRLETVVHERQLPVPDLLKIDAQGAELDILHGAQALLAGISLIQLECSFVPYNAGAPLIGGVIDQMRQWGFLVAAIEPIVFTAMRSSRFGYSEGAFIPQADLLFVAQRLCCLDRYRDCLDSAPSITGL
jgi:FkbM family methyltransferase